MPAPRLATSGLFDAEYAEIIGDICLSWNYLEDFVAYLTAPYFRYDHELFLPVMAALGNQSRIDLLMHLVTEREKNPELTEHLRFFAEAFSICRENRNILVHSAVVGKPPHSFEGLKKTSRSKLGASISYAYDIDAAKGVLHDIVNMLAFAQRTFLTNVIPLAYKTLKYEGQDIPEENLRPGPLPEKPPLPRRLTPLAPEVRKDVPPPPRSS